MLEARNHASDIKRRFKKNRLANPVLHERDAAMRASGLASLM